MSDSARELAIESGALYECPVCFHPELSTLLEAPLGIDFGGEAGVGREYPYFDRNLGMRISSAKHHREVQRTLGIEQCDDAAGEALKSWERAKSERDQHEREYDQMMAEQASDGDVRRTRDLMARVQQDAGDNPTKRRVALQDFMRRGA